MVAVQVTAPARRPRSGGIKSVTGEFTLEKRLGVGDVAWEDSGCGFPNDTRAGCYDTTFPLDYEPVDVTDDGATFMFTRNDDGTVTVDADFTAATAPAGFVAPWVPTTAVTQVVGGGSILIATNGAVTYTGTPDATGTFDYDTTDRSGGTVPNKTFDGILQHAGIGPAFAQVAGVSCWLGGDSDGGSYVQQATDLLAAGEDRKVESVLWNWAEQAASPGSAATVAEAIAVAEQAADGGYVGQPVLLMSRAAASIAGKEGAIVVENGSLHTVLGTPVIASSAVDELKVAAVGALEVWATAVNAATSPDVRGNKGFALAERVYAIGVDCEYRYVVTATALEGAA